MALELPGWVIIAFNYAGLPWPGIDEDQLRAWAASVRTFAGNITDDSARTHRVVADLASSSQSSFTSTMAARWEHHNQLVADLHEPLNVFADALDVAADAVVAQKLIVIGAAITLAGEFAATQIGAIFTLGTDEAALPEEIVSTREIVDLAIQELEGELIGKLINVAVQEISDHISRFIGSLFSGGLEVVGEYQSLKMSYGSLRDAAQTIRGHASETDETGHTSYAENANRDLEDPGEAEAGDSRWAAVVQAVKQALLDLALALFKSIPEVLARAQEDTAEAIDNAATRIQDADTVAAHAAPHDSGRGPSAEPDLVPASSGPGAVVPEDGLPAVSDGPGPHGEPSGLGTVVRDGGLRAVSDDPASSKSQDATVHAADPVDVAKGDVILAGTDVTLPGVLPLVLERTHRSSWRTGRWYGRSWMSTFDQRLLIIAGRIIGAFADGRVLTWTHPTGSGDAPLLPVTGAAWPLRRNPDGSYTVTDPQRGLTWRFEHRAGYDTGPGDQGELPLVSLTDRIGHRIAFHYDVAGQPTSVTHSGGYRVKVTVTDGHVTGLTLAGPDPLADVPLVTYEYDADGNLSGIINSSGLPLRLSYDSAGRLSGWIDRNGHYYRYTYDSDSRCIRGEGPGGALSGTFTYEPGITRWTDEAGAVTTYEITPSAQVAAITDPVGNVTRWEHDSRGRVTTRADPLGRVTRYAYDDLGNLIAITRPDGSQSFAEYDEQCQPVLLTDPDGTEWRQEYDARGNRTRLIAPDGTVTAFGHDDRGHLARVTDPDGAVTMVTCDTAGLAVVVTGPDGFGAQYERDLFGRATRITAPDGGITSLGWTTEGQLTSRTFPDEAAENWSWDAEGNLVRHLSAAGATARYEYGPFDKVRVVRWPNGARSEFGYDHQLRLIRVVHAGLTWRYDHDLAGRLIAETDYNSATTTYAYDAAGQITRRVNAVGQETTFSYDALGNPIEQSADGALTTFAYDHANRLVNARNADAEVVVDRDAMGRVTTEICNGRVVSTEYDVMGRVTRRVTPSGAVTTWEFDQAGQPVVMTANGHQLRFGYDVAGNEVRRELPGGLTLTQDWDLRGRLTAQTLARPAQRRPGVAEGPDVGEQLLQRRTYSYRADGFPERIEDLLTGNRTLSIDASGRATAVTGPNWAEQYAYDQAGNITAATWPTTPSNSATTSPDADSQGPREVTGTMITRAGNIRYRHDRAGRVVARLRTRISRKPDTWHYQWDANNRLTSVTTPDGTTWRYHYDPFGRRIAKQRLTYDGHVAKEITFTWDGPVLIEQKENADSREQTTTWDYQPGGFTPLAQAESDPLGSAVQDEVDERFYAIISDLIGTPSEFTTPDGTLVGHHQHSLWGGTLAGAHDARIPLRFPGQYQDSETGLHYNYQRYYDPDNGSYLTPDPLGLAPSPNPHAYVASPHSDGDALGLASTCPNQPTSYTVAYEHQLSPAEFGRSRAVHFNRANAGLDAALRSDPEFAARMEAIIPGIRDSVSRAGGRDTPDGWIWHHVAASTVRGRPGVMQLVPDDQHTPGSAWWGVLHPGGVGGYSEWAIPNGAPAN